MRTVHFATNRVLTGPADQVTSYSPSAVSPSDPTAVTYGTAFVEDAGLDADTVGAIKSINNVRQGQFSESAKGDLSDPGRNLLVFVHGFDNTFENAITRAAFNQQWLEQSGVPAASTAVVAFSWPSAGKLIGKPLPSLAYRDDQRRAGLSGLPLMTFFANLQPLIDAARSKGNRVFLLAHSMGNWALQAAVESWFVHGNGDALLFDEAFLAAADEVHNTFGTTPPGRLSGLSRLAKRISIYSSQRDEVLKLSSAVNLARRLGQNGPDDGTNAVLFPPAKYLMVDCSSANDYAFDLASSHQYYRRSPQVRADIAKTMG